MTTSTASGKIILFGEHAVVYGRPAIAVPVAQVRATATVTDAPPGSGCTIVAQDIGEETRLAAAAATHPLALVLRLALEEAGIGAEPDWRFVLTSDIPIASGLGSGAAISAALVRALLTHAGQPAPAETVSRLVYRSEELFHGTPSGIDNAVIAYERPVWFVKGQPPESFAVGQPFTLAIADSGIPSPTKESVGDVRRAWEADPAGYEAIFSRIADVVHGARRAIRDGNLAAIGALMNTNQQRLEELGVSSPALEKLIDAARAAGAKGAKLSGGGRGGNLIALVDEESAEAVQTALVNAGAKRVILTQVGTAGIG
ncbi:MAG: mevalonate kinase [Chloroflexi bacterium]|nr:MAG: mevalonate kinase [Chloroflexota bacterium]